ncbi:MAG: GNAT family N-acetyltransferase [Prevotella sp.]|nr:GNAT family N-acetyltransferase [Prevotella sp.]
MPEIKRYTASQSAEWNEFVERSKNGTFLFHRSYMDYHADRFADHSLMVWHKGRLCGLLPANEHDGTLYSHQGLTYGGLITDEHATTAFVCDTFEAINQYLAGQGFKQVVYKAVPWPYHRLPAEEDLYAITQICGGRLMVRHISSTIDLHERLSFTESRRSGLRKASVAGLQVREKGPEGLEGFWHVLSDNLSTKYDAQPVHTVEEMRLLMERFPQHISLFTVDDGDQVVGGTVIYLMPQVAHTQYISASHEGKQHGALDLLFDHILHLDLGCRYFDFGKSSDGDGSDLNRPLIFQKEGFGGRGVCYDWYEWDVDKKLTS